ncbi:MAG: hypothetical protein SFY67_04950 [Candidatus Melainabacteria bacterium]|nr:hypothetical protein [Candidatus Melainabacteria bacterium]
MTHKYNAREKRARRKAKVSRKLEATRKAIAAAGKSKPKSESQN